MIDLDALSAATSLLFGAWEPWLVMVPGLLIGLAFASVPGMTTSIAVVIFLPLTLYMDFLSAIIFLTSIFTGGGFGCAIPAILINIPGTPAAVATTFDGYPMAQRGQHNEALGLGLAASSFAEALSYLLLLLLVEWISRAVLKIGPPELFMVAVWGLTLIAALSGGSFVRGLMAGVFGLLVGTIGFSDRGDIRGTMGFEYLLDGVPEIAGLMGLFCAAELFKLIRSDFIVKEVEARKISLRKILKGCRDAFKYPVTLIRGSMIGIVVGIAPGVGAAVANLIAYSEARRTSKDKESFGTGNPQGVVAAEAANSSSEGGSMATLLALGIPGSGSTAVMLSVFAMHNITGGPRFISDHKDIVYAIILGNFMQTIALMVVGLGFIYIASSVVKVPVRVLVPCVLAVSMFGCFAVVGNIAGPATFVVFALIGWGMSHFGYPVAAAVVGLMLGRLTEGEMLRTYQMSGGDIFFILERPIALVIALLLVASFFLPFLVERMKKRAGVEFTDDGDIESAKPKA